MATLGRAVDKQFYRYSMTRNLSHITRLQDDASAQEAWPVNHSGLQTPVETPVSSACFLDLKSLQGALDLEVQSFNAHHAAVITRAPVCTILT